MRNYAEDQLNKCCLGMLRTLLFNKEKQNTDFFNFIFLDYKYVATKYLYSADTLVVATQN